MECARTNDPKSLARAEYFAWRTPAATYADSQLGFSKQTIAIRAPYLRRNPLVREGDRPATSLAATQQRNALNIERSAMEFRCGTLRHSVK